MVKEIQGGGEGIVEEEDQVPGGENADEDAGMEVTGGCGKCRHRRKGRGQCREWAQTGHNGYYMQGDEVMCRA